jgi:hypothetical protein
VSFLAMVFGHIAHFSLQAMLIVVSSDKDLHEFHVLMIFFFTVLHIIVVILSKISRNSPFTMHEFHGAPGVLIILFKLILGFYYLKGQTATYINSLFYLILPFTVVLVSQLDDHNKQ